MGVVAAAILLIVPSACDTSESSGSDVPAKCGLPTPRPGVRADLVPEEFMMDGAVVFKAQKTKDRLTAALNNPHSVNESYIEYKKIVRQSDFALVGEDNEGFEAELYMKKGNELGAVQIRVSQCPEATVVFLNFVRT